MDNSHDKRRIPPDINRDFQETYIDHVWEELRIRFGFPIKVWKAKFSQYRDRVKSKEKVDAFLVFGNEHINPILNEILCRRPGFPTFNALCDYVMRQGKW